VRRADNPTTLVCRLSRNPGALTSCTPQGHVDLFRGYLTFLLLYIREYCVDCGSYEGKVVLVYATKAYGGVEE
jgi:hypothetical protein